MKRLSESVWGDIRKKSLGQETRTEDDVDLITDRKLFCEYLKERYKVIHASEQIFCGDYADYVGVPVFGNHGNYFYLYMYDFSHKQKYITIRYNIINQATDLYRVIYDNYSLDTIKSFNGNPEHLVIAPKDKSNTTNSFFIEVIDLILDNVGGSFKKLLMRRNVNESVWGDIRKKSLGQEERQEFAFNPDYIDFGDKTTVYWTTNCFSYENQVKFYYDNIEGYENNGWRLPTMAEVGQLDWENCQIYMSSGKTYVKLNGGEFIFDDAGLSHINMWMQEGGYNNNAYGYNNSQGTHEFSIKRFNRNYTALYVLLVKDKNKK